MLSCDLHDYIEIACLYQYPVRITLKSGVVLEGKAADTVWNQGKQECVKIVVGDNSILLPLDSISSMQAKVSNPHFDQVSFD